VQTVNGGGTPGRAETGDRIVLTYSEPMDPYRVLAGCTGASTTVTMRLVHNGGGDRVQMRDAADTTALPLGTVFLNRTDFTGGTRSFTGSTMVMSGSTITITLGTPDGAVTTAAGTAAMTWTPVNTAWDRASNACSTTTRTEVAPLDLDF
jgi:chitinase